jgi:multiple sugar transport system substrate-binding protein
MKKGKLFLPMFSALAITLGALSSCGTTYGSADTYDIDVTLDTAGVTINMWTGFGSAVNSVLSEGDTSLIAQFEALTQINVEYETKGGYDGLQTAINLSATTIDALPQVANGYPDHMAGYIASNIQLRLDGLIANDHKRDINEPGSYEDYNGNTVTTLPHFDYEDFYSDYTKENETLEFQENGKGYVLGIPFNKSTEVLTYNRTFFDYITSSNGKTLLTTNGVGEIKLPETWTEVKSVGLNIVSLFTKLGLYGKILANDGKVYADSSAIPSGVKTVVDAGSVTADNFRPFSYDSTENLVTTLIRQYGGTLTEVDTTQTGKGYVNFNNEKTIQALTMLEDLWDSKVIGIASTPWADSTGYCSNAFKACQSLMNVGSSGGLTNILPAGNAFQVGVAPIPYATENLKFVLSQGTSLGLFQIKESDPDRDRKLLAAWKLIVFLSQAENAQFSVGTGYFPTCESAATSETYENYLSNPLQTAQDKINQEAANINNNIYNGAGTGWTKFTDPGFRGSSDIRTQIGYIPGYIFNDEYATLQDMINAVLAKLSDYVR